MKSRICGRCRSIFRLFHKAHIFNIDGHSYRLKDFNQTMKGSHLE